MTRGQKVGLGVLMLGGAAFAAAVVARSRATAPAFAPLTSGAGLKIQFSDKPLAVPAFAITNPAGRRLAADTGRGRVVLINFWATWCQPCRDEIPTLVALQQRYAGKLVILGLSVDDPGPHTAEDVAAFAKASGINYDVAVAPEDVQAAFGGIDSVPTTFVVNPEGKIVQRHHGALDAREGEQEIRVLSGLPSEAQVEVAHDNGQILSENAPPVTDVPGLALSDLTPQQRTEVLRRLNSEKCTCGCGLTIGRCMVDDPTCSTSPGLARKIVDDVKRTVK